MKMARTLHVLAFWVCGLLAAGTGLAQSAALSGVAGTRALVTIDAAAPKFLSPGQSHQGVKLLSVQAESAVIEINGQRQTVRVGEAPVSVGGSTSGDGEARRIVLTADGRGHFMPQGQINGKAVQFMVDTGATVVGIGQNDAQRINLNHEQGQRVNMQTANGTIVGYRIQLDSVRVGHVLVRNVEAVVMPQSMPYVLLGNSFLTRFQKQRANDQLTLERRY